VIAPLPQCTAAAALTVPAGAPQSALRRARGARP